MKYLLLLLVLAMPQAFANQQEVNSCIARNCYCSPNAIGCEINTASCSVQCENKYGSKANAETASSVSCVCTAQTCGGDAFSGNQGDIFSPVDTTTANELFMGNADTGWECTIPDSTLGGGGPMACYCGENPCGAGAVGANPNTLHMGITAEQHYNDYGGAKTHNNYTNWLCGNFRGPLLWSEKEPEPAEDTGGVCCESYGHGAMMRECCQRHERTEAAQCKTPEHHVGGGMRIVDDSYCN